MNWFTKLFKRKDDDYRPRAKTLYNFLTEYAEAKHELRAMRGFAWEAQRKIDECSLKMPSGKLIRRHSLKHEYCNHLAWYLLEKYSEGKITIQDDKLEPK